MVSNTRASSILVVEDNPITRKLFRVTLESAGYTVEEASDGREALDRARRGSAALILQDLRLPDMSGFDLAERLRGLPHVAETPIIAISGLVSHTEETAIRMARFHGFLAKPVAPSRLLEVVAGFLPRPGSLALEPRAEGRILVVDDDPVQRKLTALRLGDLGYTVATVGDGQAALAHARHDPPDAIVSDVLMPELDGFGLSSEVRSDPKLDHVPVVLASSAYVDEEDRSLATKMGADALVTRTPDLAGVIEALAASLAKPKNRRAVVLTPYVAAMHLNRVVQQLERQVAMAAAQAQRNATLSAELAAIDGISRVLARTFDPAVATRDILAICLEAGAASEGALYLDRPGEPLALRAVIGFGATSPAEVETFFEHRNILAQLVAGAEAVVLPSAAVPESLSSDILGRARVTAFVIARIPIDGLPAGALVMGSREEATGMNERLSFARAVATQLGQSIALARSARSRDLILAFAGDGIMEIDTLGRVTFANPAALRLLGRAADETNGVTLHDLVHVRPGAAGCVVTECTLAATRTGSGAPVRDRFLTSDGREVPVEYTLQLILESGRPAGGVIVFRDISERQRAEQLMVVEATQRQQLRIKDEFLTHVSHELRTPLTAIHEFATILLDGLAGELAPEQREYLAIVLRNANELRSMIDDLLEAARSEMARLTVRPACVPLPAIIDEVLAQFVANAQAKGVRLHTDLPGQLPSIWADAVRVRQIIGNLIGNALKFTPEGGHVTVRAGVVAERDAVQVSVVDSGPGIPPESVERVFDYMYQGPNTVGLTRKGFGIGLHLCKDLVTRQGGRIWVESTPGQGSTFCFTLPVQQQAPVEAESRP